MIVPKDIYHPPSLSLFFIHRCTGHKFVIMPFLLLFAIKKAEWERKKIYCDTSKIYVFQLSSLRWFLHNYFLYIKWRIIARSCSFFFVISTFYSFHCEKGGKFSQSEWKLAFHRFIISPQILKNLNSYTREYYVIMEQKTINKTRACIKFAYT